MDLSGVEPLSEIHTKYNCLRCWKLPSFKMLPPLYFLLTLRIKKLRINSIFEPQQLLLPLHCISVAAIKQPCDNRNLRLSLKILVITSPVERNYIVLNPVETFTSPYFLHIYYNKFFVKNQEKILDVRHRPGLLCAR